MGIDTEEAVVATRVRSSTWVACTVDRSRSRCSIDHQLDARSQDRLQQACKKISRRRKTALIQAPMWQPPPSFTVFPASCHKLTRHRSPDVDFPMAPEFLFCHFWISDSIFLGGFHSQSDIRSIIPSAVPCGSWEWNEGG